MAKKARQFPAELELRILKILWREGPLRVSDVRRLLADEGRDLAHTTVITTLNKMLNKRFVSRTQKLKGYVFKARVSERDVSQGMLTDLMDRVFDGSAVSLLLNLIDSEEIPAEEFAELRREINRQARDRK